jgi:hypothetical protein
LLKKYLKCSVWRLAVRYDIYIYMTFGGKGLSLYKYGKHLQLNKIFEMTIYEGILAARCLCKQWCCRMWYVSSVVTTVGWDVHFPGCCFACAFLDKCVEVMCEAFHHVVSTLVLLLREVHLATKQQFIFWKISVRSSYWLPFCEVRSKQVVLSIVLHIFYKIIILTDVLTTWNKILFYPKVRIPCVVSNITWF